MTRLSTRSFRAILAGCTCRVAWAVVLFALIAGGCKRDNGDLRNDEKLKVVVNKDRKLAQREANLLNRRGTLQRERQKVRDKRNALLTRRANLPVDDVQGKKEIKTEEGKLVQLEQKLAKQEISLNGKLQTLLSEKSKLGGGLSSVQSKLLLVQRREHSMALREKDVARRESVLARQQRILATRERRFAARQAQLCPAGRVTTVVQRIPAAPRPAAAGRSYSRKDVEPVFRSALRTMRRRGILAADLPPGVDRLIRVTRLSVSKKRYSRAKFAADQLLSAVRRIRINRRFIGAKISRLSRSMRRKKLRGSRKTRIASLFQRATASYGDGRFADANSKLNRIYALLN